MKKIFLAIALCGTPLSVFAAQTPITNINKFNSATTKINDLREATNTKLGVIEVNRQDHEARIAAAETSKAAVSCFADSTAFNACFALDWPTGFDTAGDYTVTGSWDFTGATVTGISGSDGISHATSDGAYYASRNGAWASLAGVFASPLGSDDNYVTDAEKLKLGNLSGANTGDQTAAEVPITDSGGYYTATTVEGALAERGADPLIYFDTATITEVENSPVAGTNTISVKSGVFQAYDANMIIWPSTISATEVGYLNGLTEALSTSLSGKQASLVSGTNIKTVNNTSLLGSGNITITGGTAPIVQAADPTSASATGWYAATGSGDIFYKSDDGLFTIAGAYTADPAGYTLTIDGTGWNEIDLISVSGSTYTADGTKTGLSGTVFITVTPDTGREATCSGTGITGSSSPYSADMSTDRTVACTFRDVITSETIGNNINGSSMLPNPGDSIYFYPVDAQFTTTGTLASYTMTARQQTGARTISAGLYTYSGGTMTLVAGSTTGNILYTASTDQTDITLTPTGSATVSAGVTYYVGVFPNGYAAVYGTTTGGTAYMAAESDGVLASSYGSLAGTTGVPGKWRITKN